MANEERAKALFDNILAETKRPTVAGKTFEYDIFKKYDTQSDTFVDTAVVKQKSSLDVTDNASKRQLRGQTIVTAHQHYLEKTSSYWRKWKSDNDALENLSMLKVKSSPVKKKKSKMRSGRVKNGKLCSFPKQGSIIPSPFPVNGPTSVKYLTKFSVLSGVSGLSLENDARRSATIRFSSSFGNSPATSPVIRMLFMYSRNSSDTISPSVNIQVTPRPSCPAILKSSLVSSIRLETL